MNESKKDIERKLLDKIEWTKQEENYVVDHFLFLGFTCPNDFMKIRVYDFLNLDMVDNNRAEEMIVYLSHYLFSDREEYSETYGNRTTPEILNWLKDNPDPQKTTLKDLICAETMSEEEMLYVFDFLSQSFYRSNEYNSRKYLYGSVRELDYIKENTDC